MDNSNNPNWPNNPFSTSPSTTPPSSTPPIPQEPAPFPSPAPASNPAAAAPLNNPWDLPSQAPTPQVADSLSSVPSWPSTPTTPQTPLVNDPPQQPQPFTETASPWSSTLPSQNPPQPLEGGGGGLTPSPLDNPWNTPMQPSAADSQSLPESPLTTEPQQQTTPVDNSTISQPTWLSSTPPLPDLNTLPTETQPPIQTEPAPTDLSHLISSNPHPDNSQPLPSTSPETLVIPPTSPEATATLPAEGYKGFPKWLIGVGVGLLIIVSGASAYFILGIGQPPKTSSIPASQTPAVQTSLPAETPAAQAAASGSANFGQLEGNGDTTTPPAPSSSPATSAADLLRQRR